MAAYILRVSTVFTLEKLTDDNLADILTTLRTEVDQNDKKVSKELKRIKQMM